MGKAIKKIHKAVQKVTKSDDALGDAGLWNLSGKNTARDEAQASEDLANRQAQEQAQLMRQMESNFAVDLQGENLTNVVAGGTAEMSAPDGDSTRRRRKGGLTSALGIQ